MQNILVTGGAGYIGSITAWELKKAGYNPIIFDSLQKGHPESISGLKLIKGSTLDIDLLKNTIKQEKIDGVIHFAAFIEVGESVNKPYDFFANNYYGSLQLMQAMQECKVDALVFSSTAAVYGNTREKLIPESHPTKPVNPYGQSKLMVEKTLDYFAQTHQLRSVILRYFNAAGAAIDGTGGESHQPESHLIPNIIFSILGNKDFNLYGDDYKTTDGTCIRDYIHVLDLAQAHILSLKYLFDGGKNLRLNVGTGRGYSNMEVIKAVEKVSSKKVQVRVKKRRTGDLPVLVADNNKIKKDLSFQTKYSDLNTIVASAWKWHQHQTY